MTETAAERRARPLQTAILLATSFAVIVVAVVCVVLSYNGLYELAVEHGPRGSHGLARLWPIIPDGLLLCGSLAVLYWETTPNVADEDERTGEVRKAWLMVATGTLISIGAQGSMAEAMTVGPLLVAAGPPVVLAVVEAFLMRMVRRAARPARHPRAGRKTTAGRPTDTATGRTGPERAVGHGREVDGRTDGNTPATTNPVGVRGVTGGREVTGRPDGQLRTVDGPQTRTLTGHDGGTGDGSDRASDRSERRAHARRLWAADTAAGREVTGASLARAVGGISPRQGQRWLNDFAAEQERHGGLRVVE